MENLSTTRKPRILRDLLVVALLVMPFTAAYLHAQERPIQIQVTAGDTSTATALASGMRYHLSPANTPAGKAAPLDSPNVTFTARTQPLVSPITSVPSFPAGTGFYPDQVFKVSSTGKTIVSTKSHPIYVNCASTCWGNPAQFLTDLGASSMIHLVDTQYVASTNNNRYTLGTAFSVTTAIFPGTSGVPTLSENDILGIVHNVALTGGAGLGHVYHVFLPQGVDTCFDEGLCYSPDNFATFGMCAYHFSVKFADITSKVYYTVLPFQNVSGCQVPTGTANGQLVDSTDNALSHELFETITDPDITTGFRSLNNSVANFEIADLCQLLVFTVTLNTRPYTIQAEWSNKYDACATTP